MLTLLLETFRDWVQTVLVAFHSMYLGYVTPQMYGAVGDGVHDDTQAIQQALRTIRTKGGGTLYFPEGTYLITQASASGQSYCIQFWSNTRLIGEGDKSVIKMADDLSKTIALFYGGTVSNISISNLTFRGSENYGSSSSGLSLLDFQVNCHHLYITDCVFQNNLYAAVRIANGAHDIIVDRCRFEATDVGVMTMGNHVVNDLTIRNCLFTGKSSINSFVNYSSEPISIFHYEETAEDIVSRRIAVENCIFEHKHTNAICVGSQGVLTQKTEIYYADIVIRDCTFRACTGAVIVRHSENVLVENLYIDDTEPLWHAQEDWSHKTDYPLSRIISFAKYCKNCIARNIVSDCKQLKTPLVFGDTNLKIYGTNSHILIENVEMYNDAIISDPKNEAIFVNGDYITLRNIVVKPISDDKKDCIIHISQLTNSYIDIRGKEKMGVQVNYKQYGDNNLVHDNKFIIDSENGTIISQSSRTNKYTIADNNEWLRISPKVSTRNYTGVMIVLELFSRINIDINSASNRTRSQTTDNNWTLVQDGYEMEVAFVYDEFMNNRTFTFPTDGNVIPILDPITFSPDYTTVCRFRQNGNKWTEIQRLREYANGQIEDISRTDLVTRSEMEQYIQETDTIPTASADYVGKSYLYTGATTSTYQKGGIYECQQTLTDTYEWKLVNVPVAVVKDIVANSADYAAFQSNIALL